MGYPHSIDSKPSPTPLSNRLTRNGVRDFWQSPKVGSPKIAPTIENRYGPNFSATKANRKHHPEASIEEQPTTEYLGFVRATYDKDRRARGGLNSRHSD